MVAEWLASGLEARKLQWSTDLDRVHTSEVRADSEVMVPRQSRSFPYDHNQ